MLFPLDRRNADSEDGCVVLVRMTARALNVMAAFFWNSRLSIVCYTLQKLRTFNWIYWIIVVKEYLNKLLVYWYKKIWGYRGKSLTEYVCVLDYSPSATCTSAMLLIVWFDNFRSYVVNCSGTHCIHANTCIVKERLQNARPTKYLTRNKTAATVRCFPFIWNLSEWNECPPQSMSSD